MSVFFENKLIATDQSVFKPEDSCISQLIAITHEIYQSFNKVRGVPLDVSKAFDKVWHEGNNVVNNIAQSKSQLSSDLTIINDWAYKWKMSFNVEYTKPAHGVAFCRK